MPYVLVSIVLGLIWAAMQYFKGEVTDLRILTAHIIVFALFGAAMWAIKGALLWIRQWRQKGSR